MNLVHLLYIQLPVAQLSPVPTAQSTPSQSLEKSYFPRVVVTIVLSLLALTIVISAIVYTIRRRNLSPQASSSTQ